MELVPSRNRYCSEWWWDAKARPNNASWLLTHGRDSCVGILQTLTKEPRVSCHSQYKGSEQLPELPWEHCLAGRGGSHHTSTHVTVPGNPPCQTMQQSALWRNCWWIRLLGQEQAWIYWRDVVRCNSPHFVSNCKMWHALSHPGPRCMYMGCPQQPLKFTGKKEVLPASHHSGVSQVGKDVEFLLLETHCTNAKTFPKLATSRIPLFYSSKAFS